ncbi:SDR family oxidoreductase [Microbacterium sp. zg.Y1090]|uniref:SDR family oxidoreductase n=1 Tax=Microbacterium TaxID=33882 RepID=UPI00214BF06D|nr:MULTISPECIES: SDR family oxidoreductase [unclassified Microbacterium]MCR2812729.1 SDR family oxidoreductase [Microbacterium sp. zg.Y1084]MCR2817477.1 SDR family oxidoreductase [Microbacterium sp. zg.Y1090]MDL5485881.1 SDR family oxidoreductase [Microbacterium sp. zg-Y1211]WIM29039.1 SDR family oxidoreductase [Microbacterium sp. zg-Y1090]
MPATTSADLPGLAGRTALVTGASDGVGLEVARALAAAGAHVIMPVRNRDKGTRAIESIRGGVPDASLELRDLDLARLDSVRALVAGLAAEHTPIHLLLANAGVVLLGDRRRHLTADGFELHFQTNFLGHFALIIGLLPALRTERSRIVMQTSVAVAFSRLDWSDLQLERRYAALRAYARSKLALALFCAELARRSAVTGGAAVTVAQSHPGVVPATAIAPDIRRRTPPPVARLTARLGNPLPLAALPALQALTADADEGAFFAPSGMLQLAGAPRARHPFHRAMNKQDAERLWRVAEDLLQQSGRGGVRLQ